MKVFVVMENDCGESTPVAAFSSSERAEDFIAAKKAALRNGSPNRLAIEEIPWNPGPESQVK